MPIVQNIMVEDADLPTTLPCIIDGLGQPSGYSPVFSPPDIGGLQIWLRADMGITIATGVSQWNDQSGIGDSNRNATQATGGAQPTLNTADVAYNNQPTLTFTGASSQYMQTGTWSHTASQPFTWIIVGNCNTGGGGQQAFIDGITVQECRVFTNANGTVLDLYAGVLLSATPVNVTVPSIMTGVFNGAASIIYLNNTQVAVSAGNASTQAPVGISIGTEYNISSFLFGKVAEVIGYSGALTQSQLATIYTYLSNRYAIPVVV